MSTATSDADEIRDLLFAYCWHMDRGEFDALGALFAHASMGEDEARLHERDRRDR